MIFVYLCIALYIIVTAWCFLDIIKDDERKHKSCATCIFSEMTGLDDPCSKCVRDSDKPLWKGLDE